MSRLHPDQAAFAGRLAELTSIEPAVIHAWIVATSGAPTFDATHDYLSPSSARHVPYPTAEHAAAAAAERIRLTGIGNAVPAGPLVTIAAIGDHPAWAAQRDRLLEAWAAYHAQVTV